MNPPTKKQVLAAFRSIKTHEFIRYANYLNCGVDYTGSSKGSVACDIEENDFRIHDKIVDKFGSFQAWVDSVLSDVAKYRQDKVEYEAKKTDREKEVRSEANRMQRITAELRDGIVVSEEDRKFYFDRVGSAIHYYYLGKA